MQQDVSTVSVNPKTDQPLNESTTSIVASGIRFLRDECWEEEVGGPDLLDLLSQTFGSYVVLPDGAADALSLWTLHTHSIDAADVSPILNVQSPMKRCGKTTLVIVVGALAFRALPTSNITPAALFRTIDLYRPTLLIDEADTQLPGNESLRSILNAGHTRRTATVIRSVATQRGGYEPCEFSVWGAKLVAGIGKLPETVADRSIRIMLHRQTSTERVQRLRQDRIHDELAPLRSMAMRWAEDNRVALRSSDPKMPSELDDRACDNWRALLAIADEAGGEWPSRARVAASRLSGHIDDSDKAEPMVMLLADMRQILNSHSEPVPTQDILSKLHALEERPWVEWFDGRPLSAAQLAKLMKPLAIRPREFRLGEQVLRGYASAQFHDAWARYLPQGATSATSITQPPNVAGVAAPRGKASGARGDGR